MATLKNLLKDFVFKILTLSIRTATKEQGNAELVKQLRRIVPDLKNQYTSFLIEGDYLNTKVYAQHAFQVKLTLDAIKKLPESVEVPVIGDIGDSSGTHIIYLQEILNKVDALSINSDPVAIKKIRSKGLQAFQSRAESLHKLEEFNKEMDILISFEMLEHLKDPIGFLETMAKESECKSFVITVPWKRKSRISLDRLEDLEGQQAFNPEVTHIFELCPKDWDKLFKFSGWKVIKRSEYFQYPRFHPLRITKFIWQKLDFEGFYGVILEKDDTFSSRYQDY